VRLRCLCNRAAVRVRDCDVDGFPELRVGVIARAVVRQMGSKSGQISTLGWRHSRHTGQTGVLDMGASGTERT
jgi:hypothetical protein